METNVALPRVVLICHAEDQLDAQGLAAWLASSMQLVGLVLLREGIRSKVRRIRYEIRRVGWFRFLDGLAFRLYYRFQLARADAAWKKQELARLRARYPARLDDVPRMIARHPGTAAVRRFVQDYRPDLTIARCKFILKPDVFNIPRAGTFVLHPGICPEYRNAHGCFWALANRDLERVGMTLLRVDAGVDTGPMVLQATYRFEETLESHVVIQYRVVLENLDAIERALVSACDGKLERITTEGRRSATWGQPWLSAYWKWKTAIRRERPGGWKTPARGVLR